MRTKSRNRSITVVPGRAIVDIYRIEDGKVDEHRDVIQDIPEQAENSNGMF